MSTRHEIREPYAVTKTLQLDCECEAAFVNMASLMVDFDDTPDSTIAVMLDTIDHYTVMNPRNSFCQRAAAESAALRQYCSTTTVKSIKGIDATMNAVTLNIAPDTVYVLHFWGTWCPPCLAEMSDVQAVEQQLRERGVVMIHIAAENPEKVRAWREYKTSFTGVSVVTTASPLDMSFPAGQLMIRSYPTYVIIDKGNRRGGRFGSMHRVQEQFK
jgi:thiol-disulfide isomerase/thioredoxin